MPLLAVTPLPNPLSNSALPEAQPVNLFGLGLRDILLVVGVAVVIGLLLFIWVYIAHKGRRRHHSSHALVKPTAKAEKSSSELSSSQGTKFRRRRRRHSDNLPRNPTLGETGGLPPIRPEEEPPSEVPQP